MPAYTTLSNRSFMICANPSALTTPVHPPQSPPPPHPRGVLTDGVLMFISINARVHNIAKQIVHDMCQPLSVHHPRTPPSVTPPPQPRVYSPMGYLCLSVSMPAYTTLPNRSFMICARPSAFITPVYPPQSTPPPTPPCVYSPMGYLCLSVSMPAFTTLPNGSFMICANTSAFITPVHPPQSPHPHTPVCTHRWGTYVYQYQCPRTQHCQTDRS